MTPATEAALLDAAERRYAYLLERGTDGQAALQRTWDAYERAYGYPPPDGFDPSRDIAGLSDLGATIN